MMKPTKQEEKVKWAYRVWRRGKGYGWVLSFGGIALTGRWPGPGHSTGIFPSGGWPNLPAGDS